MKKIYKYQLQIKSEQKISLPDNAKILHVAMQGANLYLWAQVDPEVTRKVVHTFHVYGTGHPIPDNLHHWATIKDYEFVWHVFEELNG